MEYYYRWNADQLVIDCHLQPGARQEGIVGVHGSRLKIRIAAPPVDGRANERLLRFLAEAFDVPLGQVSLLQGNQSRYKRVAIRSPSRLPAEMGIARR